MDAIQQTKTNLSVYIGIYISEDDTVYTRQRDETKYVQFLPRYTQLANLPPEGIFFRPMTSTTFLVSPSETSERLSRSVSLQTLT